MANLIEGNMPLGGECVLIMVEVSGLKAYGIVGSSVVAIMLTDEVVRMLAGLLK